MTAVSVVLLNYKRPYHLPAIVESLDSLPFVDELILWNNGREGCLIDIIPECRASLMIVDSQENLCTLGRFKAAELARNSIVYTQDDDVLIRNVPRLLEKFLAHREKITAGLVDRHYRLEANQRPFMQLGWGSFHLREWMTETLEPYISRFGEDELLCRKADRIYTSLFAKHDPVHSVDGIDIERLKGPDGRDSDRDPNSLWLRGDHGRLTEEAMARVELLKREVGAA
jgi:hypothetical protein